MLACCINREAKFTTSPKTEYSRLYPVTPITPVKTVPVATPMEQLTPLFSNSSMKRNDIKMARTASSW